MSPFSLTLLIFAIMLVLMALRVPIAIAMFVAGAVWLCVCRPGWAR
jgi:C4-dicarboxylate transporter DctM subunit